MKTLSFGLLFVMALCLTARAQVVVEAHAHEYAPLREARFELKDFTFKTLDDVKVNLREMAAGNKLVLVHYFAAWCHNSNYDVDTVNELYRKYKDRGLAVIAICEYSKPGDLREFIKKHQPEYPICLESQKTKDREKTTHWTYRKAADDTRDWGTPFNILLSASDFNADGDVIANRALVGFGELMKSEVETYIRQQLKIR